MHLTPELFAAVQRAAEYALAGMCVRALFEGAVNDHPGVASVTIRTTADAIPGLSVVEVEALDAEGVSIAGWSL